MKTILIIGAGFSGAVIAARLLRHECAEPLRVYLLNGHGRIARGMAYGTQSPDHVLNVPAGNMSAFDEDPEHFLRYAREIDNTTTAASFVSRRIYGDYLEWLLTQAEKSCEPEVELLRLYQFVTHITPAQNGGASLVTLEGGETIFADKVVLALGHFPSSNPRIADAAFYDSARYLRDPWDQVQLNAIPANAPVLLLGTGLTAVDVAMTLMARYPTRHITAVSRRGLLPQHHRHTASKPTAAGASAIWGNATTVRAQLRAFRQFCRAIAAEGRDWREGLALLRPVTADLWQAYTAKERKRFLRHVQPYWDTHRHRLAPSVHVRFNAALAAGTVRTLAARVTAFHEHGDDVLVTLRPRGTSNTQTVRTQYVINCTGPCSDPRGTNNTLVLQLLADGLMRADPLGLGIDVAQNCAVVAADGRPSDSLYYIGPWLKANYWEATAVPDLRRFAQELAQTLLN